MFRKAIARKPCPALVDGISSTSLGKPDFGLAMKQHEAYVSALEDCGLRVRVLEADNRFPDSTFVEDVALCFPTLAILTNPGAPSRNGEKQAMYTVLKEEFKEIQCIEAPGTLDAGDVMMVGDHYFVGLSSRTNLEGAEQLLGILEDLGKSGETLPLEGLLHLKSGVSYLENDQLLAAPVLAEHPAFAGFRKIQVVPEEEYAANSLWVNGKVLVPEGFPKTRRALDKAGFPVISLDVSEFRKLDGGLSCLSLRF